MPQSDPITILLLNEHAEEIKLVTISLRGFFTDVRIEVAYSAEEADRIMQAPANAWAVARSSVLALYCSGTRLLERNV